MRRLSDRWWLAATFAILSAVVIFLSYDVDRRLTEQTEAQCQVAWMQLTAVANDTIVTLTATDLDALDETEREAIQESVEQTFVLVDEVAAICGEPPASLQGGI